MKSKQEKIRWFLSFLPLILTSISLIFLPNPVPMHYNAAGQITRWGSKYEMLIIPIILMGASALIDLTAKVSMRKEEREANQKAMTYLNIGVLLYFNAMNLIFLLKAYSSALNTGFTIDISKSMGLLLSIGLIGLGNMIPKCKQNAALGIRTFWTLKDQEVWYKTHRVGGRVMVIGGVISTIVTGFYLDGILAQFFPLGVLIVVAVAISVYSYVIYKRKKSV